MISSARPGIHPAEKERGQERKARATHYKTDTRRDVSLVTWLCIHPHPLQHSGVPAAQ